MERRREPRFIIDADVTVTVLGSPKQLPVTGRVLDMSGSGLRLMVRTPIPCGAVVKIEGNDMLLLAEVCRSNYGLGAYDLGLKITHALTSLSELAALNRALLGEPKVRV